MPKYTESINDKNKFKALFVIGTGGSGKSFVVDSFNKELGAKILNSDNYFERGLIRYITGLKQFKQAKAEFDRLSQDDTFKITPEVISNPDIQKFRDTIVKMEYSEMAKSWLNGMLPIILDTTGANRISMLSKLRFLETIGYDVACLYVYVDVSTALKRNKMRPREVPDSLIIKQRKLLDENLYDYQTRFGSNFFYFDNSYDLRNPDNYEHKQELDKVGKEIMNFFKSSIQNPTGIEVIESLKELGGKYYEDYTEDFFNRADNAFKYKQK